MKYIDADRLRAEIKFAKSVYDDPKRVVHGVADAYRQDGRAAMCDDILKRIDSLQQDDEAEVEYIRKDTLLEWVKEKANDYKGTANIRRSFELMIKKIESL